jgi:hypothetical protein
VTARSPRGTRHSILSKLGPAALDHLSAYALDVRGLLCDALDGKVAKSRVFVADGRRIPASWGTPPFLRFIHALELKNNNALRRRRAIKGYCLATAHSRKLTPARRRHQAADAG